MTTKNTIAMPDTVAVIVDGWNALRGADQVLDFGDRVDNYVVDFGKLADEIAARRHRPSQVVSVSVVLGVAHREHNPAARAVVDRCVRYWSRDKRVRVMAFENDRFSGQEKGVDMELGMQLTELVADPVINTVVMFSADRDLQPAIDRAATKRGTHLELARWEGQRSSLEIRRANGTQGWCHWLGPGEFHRSATPRGHQLAA